MLLKRSSKLLFAGIYIDFLMVGLLLASACSSKKPGTCTIKQADKEVTVLMNEKDGLCVSLSSYLIKGTEKSFISEWKLNFPAYQFACSDINMDGVDDILIGITKTTRFDTITRKRLFIFKLVDGYIRPLWLGSRVGRPLVDFQPIKQISANLVRTLEEEENGNYLVAEYKWKGFGLAFVRFIARDKNLKSAKKIFTQNSKNEEL